MSRPARCFGQGLTVIPARRECAWCAEERCRHFDCLGVGCRFGRVRVPGVQSEVGESERCSAPPGVWPAGRLLAGCGLGEHQPGDAVFTGELGRFVAGGGDVRCRGDVDLGGAAEPGAVPCAGPLVRRRWTGTGSCCPCRAAQRRQAAVARSGRRPSSRCPASAGSAWRSAASVVPASMARQRASPGCSSPVSRCRRRRRPGPRTRGAARGDRAERQVAAGGHACEVGGDRLPGKRGDADGETPGPGMLVLGECDRFPWPAGPAGDADPVARSSRVNAE